MEVQFVHSTDLEDKILDKVLFYSLLHGWSEVSLAKALVACHLSKDIRFRIFDGRLETMTQHLAKLFNRQLREHASQMNLGTLGIMDQIEKLIMMRFHIILPHREAMRKVLVYLSWPTRLSLASKLLWSIADEIWFITGDTATDWDYYSKRLSLSWIYSKSTFFWLSDQSEDYVRTLYFVRRQIRSLLIL